METTERVGVLQTHNHRGEPCGCIITKGDLDQSIQLALESTPPSGIDIGHYHNEIKFPPEKQKPVHNPPWPRCECGHRKAKHFIRGERVKCMWARPNPETGVMEDCDCEEYWVLEEKLFGKKGHEIR